MKQSTKRKTAHNVFIFSWVLFALALIFGLCTWSMTAVYVIWAACFLALVASDFERYYIHLVRSNLQDIMMAIGNDSEDASRGTHYVDVTSEDTDFSIEYELSFDEVRIETGVEFMGDKESHLQRINERVKIVDIEAYEEDGQIDSEAVEILMGRQIKVVR